MDISNYTSVLDHPVSRDERQYSAVLPDKCMSAHRLAAAFLLLDAAILLLAGALPVLLYDGISADARGQYLLITCSSLPLVLLVAHVLQAYRTEQIFVMRRLILRIVLSFMITFSMLMMIGVATKISGEYSRIWFFSWLALCLVSVIAVRAILLGIVETKLAKGSCLQRALIVNWRGSTFTGDQLALETRNRIRAVGSITIENFSSAPDLEPYLRHIGVDVVVLSVPLASVDAAMRKFEVLSQYAIEVLVLPQADAHLQKALRLRHFGKQTFLQVAEPPITDWNSVIKRAEDIIVACTALILTSPLLILTALAIRLESRGPVLFKQVRAGFNGGLIEVWKFRSMFAESTDHHASSQVVRDDPRITFVGHFIRKSSIDELPQFWNVLRGDMSVVGPRPHALGTSADGKALTSLVEEYAARHRVKPGITGWAQVNGARGALQTQAQVKNRVAYDLHYIENWSLTFDIKIILMTVIRVLRDPSAY